MKSFIDIFAEHATHPLTSNRVALISGPNQITYSELKTLVNKVALSLLDKIKDHPQDTYAPRICFFLERGPDPIILILACLKVGLAFVPIDPATPPGVTEFPTERNRKKILSASPALLITQNSLKEHSFLIDIGKTTSIPCCDIADLKKESKEDKEPKFKKVSPETLAYIMYSSGSTGEPKGIAISHSGLVPCMEGIDKLLKVTPQDVVAQYASYEFDASIQEILSGLGRGAALYIVTDTERRNFDLLTGAYRKFGVTVTTLTPGVLVELKPKDHDQLRAIIVTGEPLTQFLVDHWQKWIDKEDKLFINGYGPTEVTIATTLSGDKKTIHLGLPLASLELFLQPLDAEYKPDGSPVPITVQNEKLVCENKAQQGELIIAGPGVALEYWKNPELTRERFFTKGSKRHYHTKDFIIINDDGRLIYKCRIDPAKKINGEFIDPEGIEKIISEYPGLKLTKEDVFIHINDSNQIRVFIRHKVSPPDDIELIAKISTFIAPKLKPIERPSFWNFLETFPLNQSLKKDITTLLTFKPIRLKLGHRQLYGTEEHRVCEIWQKVLGLDCIIYPEENFYELGGDSIKANRLRTNMQEIYSDFQLIPKQTLTIANCARSIRREKEGKSTPIEILGQHEFKSSEPVETIFLIHSLLGDPRADFNVLQTHLRGYRLYGLKARGLAYRYETEEIIEDIAYDYCIAIKQIQKSGPYLLIARSAGGIIAYEMARQMQEQGDEVLVIACDTFCPELMKKMQPEIFSKKFLEPLAQRLAKAHFQSESIQSILKEFKFESQSVDNQINQWKSRGFELPKSKDKALCKEINLYCLIGTLLAAIQKYRIKVTVKDFYLIAATHTQREWLENENLGWTIDKAHIKSVAADHFTLLDDEKIVKQTYNHILSCINDYIPKKLQLYRQALITFYAKTYHIPNNRDAVQKYYDLVLVPVYTHKPAESKSSQQVRTKDLLSQHHNPGRILITGDPGTGKTTLCKEANWLWSQEVGPQRYDWVFLLRLREIARVVTEPSASLIDVVIANYKDILGVDSHNAGSIFKKIFNVPERVLIIADGLNELEPSFLKTVCWQDLQNHPASIITSQNYATNVPVQLHYQNKGYRLESIQAYVTEFFENHRKGASATPLLNTIKYNPSIQTFATNPFQLELLCNIYFTPEAKSSDSTSITLTQFFKESQIQKLRSCYRRTQQTEFTPSDSSLRRYYQHELIFLMNLAFEAHTKRTFYLTEENLKSSLSTIKRNLEWLKANAFFSDYLSNPSPGQYEFVHHLFQDYFAAQHWVQLLSSNEKAAIKFIQLKNFDPHYERMWWFIAGLLKKNTAKLTIFIDSLLKHSFEPGVIYTTCLEIRCLDECELQLPEAILEKIIPRIINTIIIDPPLNTTGSDLLSTTREYVPKKFLCNIPMIPLIQSYLSTDKPHPLLPTLILEKMILSRSRLLLHRHFLYLTKPFTVFQIDKKKEHMDLLKEFVVKYETSILHLEKLLTRHERWKNDLACYLVRHRFSLASSSSFVNTESSHDIDSSGEQKQSASRHLVFKM